MRRDRRGAGEQGRPYGGIGRIRVRVTEIAGLLSWMPEIYAEFFVDRHWNGKSWQWALGTGTIEKRKVLTGRKTRVSKRTYPIISLRNSSLSY